ncbi:transcription factor bHLH106-like [Chenopodium quinoa]|uniref:transcription factor bHLH106-like n=1 Tax=Chenopodium quinoa TaxID=63459 RepID=UPI000B7794E1|nr:transcription factor bHLH106-like [Chenopodium quinoa]
MQQFSDEFPNNTTSSEMEIYRYLTGAGVNDVVNWPAKYNNNNNNTNNNNYSSSGSCSASFYTGLLNETTEAKALAASRIHHKEAEKRRRERINSHLDRLRSILPCTSKTDKATLLSKVVQRVLELKRQTSELNELDNLMIPSENDEFAVYIHNNNNNNNNNDDDNQCDTEDGDSNNNNNSNSNKLILKASLCCEDRPDLFADLNGVLSSLNLKTLRAEVSSLGGRIQSVFIVSADSSVQSDECAVFLRDALKGVVQRSGSDERLKRRRRVFDTAAEC